MGPDPLDPLCSEDRAVRVGVGQVLKEGEGVTWLSTEGKGPRWQHMANKSEGTLPTHTSVLHIC